MTETPAASPRVLYLGYGATGCACLTELVGAGFEIAGVVCRRSDRPDRPDRNDRPDLDAGAGSANSVFGLSRQLGLRTFGGADPNAPDFVATVRRLAPDLLLSVQYDRILKPPLLAVPRHGAFNLHFGPLPRLRGCFPTKWAILGDEPAGVTLHCIDPGIDTGDVVAQTVVPLSPAETDESLYRKLERTALVLFRGQLQWMRPLRPPRRQPQDEAAASYHPKELPFGGVIAWQREAAWLERFIRAFTFPPYPAARTWWQSEEVQIRAPVAVAAPLPGAPGDFVPRGGDAIAVTCGAGSLVVREVILAGQARPASILTRAGAENRRFAAEAP